MTECYVCMQGVSEGELRRKPCACRTLAVHRRCLEREIRSNIANEPLRCRVCGQQYAFCLRREYGPELWLWVVLCGALFVDQCLLLTFGRASPCTWLAVLAVHVGCSLLAMPFVASSLVFREVRTYPLLNDAKQSA